MKPWSVQCFFAFYTVDIITDSRAPGNLGFSPSPQIPHNLQRIKHTFALWYWGRAIEVCGSIPRTCNAVVLTEVWLVGAYSTTNAAMDTGIIIMAWGALNYALDRREKCKDPEKTTPAQQITMLLATIHNKVRPTYLFIYYDFYPTLLQADFRSIEINGIKHT